MADTTSDGFGTRQFLIPNQGKDLRGSQILKGSGYVTINLRGAHYRSDGNLWQAIFGGSDKVSLSSQVTHVSGTKTVSGQSIEDTRQIKVGQPYYFGSTRAIGQDLPTDCEAIDLSVQMSAIKNDNLSGALDLLNSGELKSTLALAPPAVSGAVAVANVVKKLLSNTDPQSNLQAYYAGRVSPSPSDDPLRDYCLIQGTLIMIYREFPNDTGLDGLQANKFSMEGDGLKYEGQTVQNTYVMLQISFTELLGEDASADWFAMFSNADQTLDGLIVAASDADRQKIWTAAYATYQQAAKLVLADASFTVTERQGIAAKRFTALRKKYADLTGQPKPAPPDALLIHAPELLRDTLVSDRFEKISSDYRAGLSRLGLQ